MTKGEKPNKGTTLKLRIGKKNTVQLLRTTNHVTNPKISNLKKEWHSSVEILLGENESLL